MKYQPLNDVIDPDVEPEGELDPEVQPEDPGAPEDAYLIGAAEERVRALLAKSSKGRPTRRKPWVKPAAIALAALCIGLTIWNLSRVAAGPPAPPPPSPFQVKQALYLGVMKIEAYRRVHGVTPDTLEASGLSNPPYAYTRLGSTEYALGFEAEGSRLEYDSSIAVEQFFGSPKDMLAMGDSQWAPRR